MDPIPKTTHDNASPSPEHYLSLRYPIELLEDEGAWVASHPDLPGCASFGPDANSAVENLGEVRRLWIEGQIASGNKIPEPSAEERYSGKFVLRIPKSMHRLAEIRARHEGVSLNALITNILAGSLNFGGQSGYTAIRAEQRHEHSWHRTFVIAESTHGWSTAEAEHPSHKLSGKRTIVFLDRIAGGLATHHRSVFDPSKECYHAGEKHLAHK
jgi:predicted RNase H-like HicB family nuclease